MTPHVMALAAAILLQAKTPDPHPVWLVLEEEPGLPRPELAWNGYPTKRWQALEKAVEDRVELVRAAASKGQVEGLEELRFIGRAHARENVATKNRGGHQSKHFGYVSERAGVFYGWTPNEWVIPGSAFDGTYKIADNGGAVREMTAEGWIDNGWMTSPGHKAALLGDGVRFLGMGLGGVKDFTPGHMVFASMPRATYDRIRDLQPLYDKLSRAKKSDVKQLLDAIVEKAEGSSFIRIAPLLKDQDRDVRLVAVSALRRLQELVPKAKGPVFALLEFGVQGGSPDTAQESAKALKALTGQTHTTPAAWADWWAANWKTYKADPAPEEPKAPATPALTVRDPVLGTKLGLLENWAPEKGQWTQERSADNHGQPGAARAFEAEGIRGAGDSAARFKGKIPSDCRIEFTLNVVDGMRPRMHIEGLGFFLGNEGFEKHLYVYGDGARELKGRRINYDNGRPVGIRIELWGEDFSVWVDGKICAVGKRKTPADGVGLLFRGGDDWSKGACTWSKFSVFTRP